MVKTDQDRTMYAGNKQTFQFTVVDEDNGDAAFDLSSYTVKWALTRMDSSGEFTLTPLVEKETGGSGIVISGAGNDIATVTLLGADTDTIFGDFYQELEAFDGSDESIVLATGKVTIIRNVENT